MRKKQPCAGIGFNAEEKFINLSVTKD